MNAQQQQRRHRQRSFPPSRTAPMGTARMMVRGATACTTSAAAPLASFAGTVGTGIRTKDGHFLGMGLDDDNGTHPHRQQQQQDQPQKQQQPARGEQQKQPQEVQANTHDYDGDVAEPTAEWEAMVLERVSRMGLGDDNNNNNNNSHTDNAGPIRNRGSSEVPSPAATSTSTSTSASASISTSISTSSTASVEDPVQITITAPTARRPARRFRVRAAGTTSAATNQSIAGIDGTSMHQSTESNNNKTNKRGATDLAATPVTNNQTTRPGDQTPPPTTVDTACNVGAHPLLLMTNTGSTSTSGLLPRLSPPLGLRSPTTTNINPNTNVNDKCRYIHATASSASSSPTSTTATPTVTAQMLSCSIPTCTQQQLSADGTSLAIDGGPNGGPRKRRMLKKRHRRSNASLIAGAAFGCGGGGNAANDGGSSSAVKEIGCLGGILPDLTGIFDGACGGGADDVVADGDGTASTGNAYANGIGGRSSPHSLAAGGCGSSSTSSSSSSCSCSFPDPFGLVTKTRRSRSRSPRPSSTTLGSGGTSSQDSSRFARPNFFPVPHPLARPKRPSAPTPPGASMMSQTSSVFDRRLDRLASGVQMPSSKGTSTTAGDSSSGSGMPAPPNLVPKFRASPLPFSANLHVTPQPRRATASRQHTHHGKSIAGGRNGTAGRRVRGGAKPGSHMGGTLSASTGFAGSATFAAPSFSRGSTPVPPPGNGGTIPAPPPTPVDTML